MKTTNKAFTLIEIAIVIAIISVLTLVLSPQFKHITENAKLAGLEKDRQLLETTAKAAYEKIKLNSDSKDDTMNQLFTELSKNQDLQSIRNPYTKTLKGISLEDDIEYTNEDTQIHLFTEEPYAEDIPKGTLYLFEKENDLVTGIGTGATSSNKPTFKKVYTSPFNSLAIGTDNNIYTWGSYGYYENPSKPFKLNLPEVKSVSAASNTFLITMDNQLYGWGDNLDGSLGTGNTLREYLPVEINLPNGIIPKQVIAGNQNTLIITTDGELYGCGNNSAPHILLNKSEYTQTTFIKLNLPNNIKVKSAALGKEYITIITTEDEVYVWGNDGYGQLGIGNNISQSTPVKLTLPHGVIPKTVVAASSHTFLLSKDGELYAFGRNYNGELGLGHTTNQSTPTKVSIPNNLTVRSIITNDYNTFIRTSDNSLYAWGMNTYGQLGTGDTTNRLEPTKINLPNNQRIKSITSGGSYTIVKTADNTLYSWGYNYNGQLGIGNTTNQLTPQEVIIPTN